MKNSSDDEEESPKSSQPNPFSFKNFQFSVKGDLLNEDDMENEPKLGQVNPFSFKTYFHDDQNIDLPDIDSNFLDQPEGLDDLPAISVPVGPEINVTSNTDFLIDKDFQEQKFFENNQLIAKQQKIIAKLEKRVKELESKEESEAKTLELLVQQVEKNLEKTTARALEAESKVEFFKKETAQMKHQIKLLKNENQLLQNASNKNLFITIKKMSTELNTAALSAEKSLSFLSNGVETLKLIASNLESLEKISETNE